MTFQQQTSMITGYDGLAELWWESAETLQAAFISPQSIDAGAILVEDEAKFIDLAKSIIFFSEEHIKFE
jgi:hypothetical protein